MSAVGLRAASAAVVAMLMLSLSACTDTASDSDVKAANRVFYNGAIYTVDGARSWAEAVAVSDGRIVYVGDDDGAMAYVAETTRVTDLDGQMMLPGFHDSHVHIMIGIEADTASPPQGVIERDRETGEPSGTLRDAAMLLVKEKLPALTMEQKMNGMSDNRHQIVHLQLIHEDDLPRFGTLDIGAVFQLLWAYPDPAALELDVLMLGEERTWQMYPAASVQRAGGRIVGGSDYWVTDLNPLLAIETAITRQNPWTDSGAVLNETERLDLATTIAAYTINGAYQMGREHEQGSIEIGKRADLIVLDRNLFELAPSEISDARVTATLFDGKVVYE